MRIKSSLGFTLIELVISLGVSSTVLVMFFMSMNQTVKTKVRVEAMLNSQQIQLDIMRDVSDLCGTYNTLSYSYNGLQTCLSTGNCTGIVDRPIEVVNSEAEVQSSINYNDDGTRCTRSDGACDQVGSVNLTLSCDSKGADPCARSLINYSLKWDVLSGNDKILPWKSSNIPLVMPRIYRSCQEANNFGNKVSNLYWIDSDGYGGRCPIQVYCTMLFDTGRALVANAPNEDYGSLPVVDPPLLPTQLGRLSTEIVHELVNRSSTKKLVMVLNTPADGDLFVNIDAPDFDSNKKILAEPTNCSELNEDFETVTSSSSSAIDLYLQNDDRAMGYNEGNGFYCTSCGEAFCGIFPVNCCKDKIRGQVYVL